VVVFALCGRSCSITAVQWKASPSRWPAPAARSPSDCFVARNSRRPIRQTSRSSLATPLPCRPRRDRAVMVLAKRYEDAPGRLGCCSGSSRWWWWCDRPHAAGQIARLIGPSVDSAPDPGAGLLLAAIGRCSSSSTRSKIIAASLGALRGYRSKSRRRSGRTRRQLAPNRLVHRAAAQISRSR